MNFPHQGTGGINYVDFIFLGPLPELLGSAVSSKENLGAVGNLVQRFHPLGARLRQVPHYLFIVNDITQHIDLAVLFARFVSQLDCVAHAKAIACVPGDSDFHFPGHLQSILGVVIPTCFWYFPLRSLYEVLQGPVPSKNSTWHSPSNE